MDISADLTELGRTPITVVSAGVKSILDIGRTLEYLVRILIVTIRGLTYKSMYESGRVYIKILQITEMQKNKLLILHSEVLEPDPLLEIYLRGSGFFFQFFSVVYLLRADRLE